jgi:hypothetical protein
MTGREAFLLRRLETAVGFIGTHTASDVIREAREGRVQVWEGDGALIVTQIVDYPQLRALHYLAVAGTLPAVRELQATADAWGVIQGARRAEAVGRLGWERVQQPEGWHRVAGFWVKELGHDQAARRLD